MSKTYIFEGNTTNEAIEKGLKELNVSKNQVEIKVLEENKKSFFSILAPRIVKVEFTMKSNKKPEIRNDVRRAKTAKKEIIIDQEEVAKAKEFIENFIKEFVEKLSIEEVEYEVKFEENILKIDFKNDKLKSLIGYRGETLNALENIINAILKSNKFNLRASCNINNFREKRTVALNELADKVSKTVVKTKKNITLEPMPAYERKVIHTRLQNDDRVTTYSVGEGSRRRLVIALK